MFCVHRKLKKGLTEQFAIATLSLLYKSSYAEYMKQGTHPTVYPAIFVDTSCGEEFMTTTTMSSEQTRDVDGITYHVHNIEISSASHPFFTGKEILIDTSRRIEKFEEKLKKQEAAAAARKGKKAKNAARAAKKATEEANS